LIWNKDEEEEFLFLNSSSFFSSSVIDHATPSTLSFTGINNLTTGTQTAISQGLDRSYHTIVGYGLVVAGAAIFLGTRGAGWKPAAFIMSTGLNNLAEAGKYGN